MPEHPDPGAAATLRPTSARVLYAAVVTAVVAWAAGTGLAPLLPGAPVAVAALVLGWSAFWRAAVVVDGRGVRLLNVVRDVEVPWAALDDVSSRWALTLHAGGRAHRSWSATARSQVSALQQARAERRAARLGGGQARPPAQRADAESARAVVERHRERWLAGGREPAGGEVVVRWNVPVVVTVAACAVVTLAAAVF